MGELVRVVEYDDSWPGMYEEERAALVEALGPFVVDIQHVGSTSVPGLVAKPIIDIAIAIEKYPLPASAIEAVVALGYEYKGELGIPRRHYFRKGEPRTHHVHINEVTSDDWKRQVALRDYLRANPDAATRYGELKRGLARQHEYDVTGYTDAKSPFILEALRQASQKK